MNHIPIFLILISIIFSLIIYLFHNKYANYLAFICQTILIVSTIYYYQNLKILGTHDITIGGWSKTAGIALHNDWLSISLIFLTLFLFTAILIYIWDKNISTTFLFFLLFLEGIFLGLLQTSDLFSFFIFMELITIISSILIVFKKEGHSLKIVLYYLLFNSAGMMFYLLGISFLYVLVGTLNMELATTALATLGTPISVKATYMLIMSALAVKSAFFPVYNWLPKAHGAAPPAVSALLSGLLVKSGLYGFIRINQVFGIMYQEIFMILGFTTAIVGVIFALSQKDIKQILAYHTISQVGIMLIGISQMEGNLFYGGILHLINHAMFKSLLFLGAGIIISEYGTKNVYDIKGVFKRLPFTSILMIIGMLSITGSPFFNGFVSKSIITYSLGTGGNYLFNVINLGTAISFVKMSHIFVGEGTLSKKSYLCSNIAMSFLAIMCIVLGSFAMPIVTSLWSVELMKIKTLSPEKWFQYIATVACAAIIYRKIIKKDIFIIRKIRETDMAFDTANIALIFLVFVLMGIGVFA